MKKNTATSLVVLLTFSLISGIAFGQQGQSRPRTQSRQRPPAPNTAAADASTQTAVTRDGRTVILKNDGTWEYQQNALTPKAPTTSKQTGVLSIEAGLVFQSGDVKPVARTTFYLLNADLAQILREAGIKPTDKLSESAEPTDNDFVLSFAFANRYAALDKYQAFLPAALATIKPHIVQSVTTDFTGKAVFEPVPEGVYYLVGVATPAKAIVAWNLKVNVKAGQSSITLDQNNAEVAA